MVKRLQRSTLFPYTTLFRSALVDLNRKTSPRHKDSRGRPAVQQPVNDSVAARYPVAFAHRNRVQVGRVRSEEHTSELQSHVKLVCRLLLEKKNKRTNTPSPM